MSKNHSPSDKRRKVFTPMERRTMHMSAVRFDNIKLEEMVHHENCSFSVGPTSIYLVGAPMPCNSRASAVLGKLYRCNQVASVPQELFRADLSFVVKDGISVPCITRKQLLALSDREIDMITGSVEASNLELARIHRRIDIAMAKFFRALPVSVMACRVASLEHKDKYNITCRVWNLIKMSRRHPGFAAIRIAAMLNQLEKEET